MKKENVLKMSQQALNTSFYNSIAFVQHETVSEVKQE